MGKPRVASYLELTRQGRNPIYLIDEIGNELDLSFWSSAVKQLNSAMTNFRFYFARQSGSGLENESFLQSFTGLNTQAYGLSLTNIISYYHISYSLFTSLS